jgi:hypothetical protein
MPGHAKAKAKVAKPALKKPAAHLTQRAIWADMGRQSKRTYRPGLATAITHNKTYRIDPSCNKKEIFILVQTGRLWKKLEMAWWIEEVLGEQLELSH